MNERRNPTLCADNRFFSSSFHGFSRGDDSVAQRLWGRLALNRDSACAVERRWTTAGESPARELGSLHPEAIRAAVEETKPSEPLV